MREFQKRNTDNAIENYCANQAISKKIENSARFNENSSWHDINNHKQEVRSDHSKHSIH